MTLIAFILAIFIGLLLGIIGGGGSILTVPVLVYISGIAPGSAISYSLFIVGLTALLGAYDYFRKRQIDLKAALVFAFPSFLSVMLTRKFILPAIPETLFRAGGFVLSKDILVMTVFASLMLFSAFSMIRQKKVFRKLASGRPEEGKLNYKFIFVEGLAVGALTGFAGAGGGFLIIPALVLFAGLPMKTAVGTSLLIIAINSLTGFSTDLAAGLQMDWNFLLSFSCFAVAGILPGVYLAKYIDASRLKPMFGWFTLVTGICIILKELVL